MISAVMGDVRVDSRVNLSDKVEWLVQFLSSGRTKRMDGNKSINRIINYFQGVDLPLPSGGLTSLVPQFPISCHTATGS